MLHFDAVPPPVATLLRRFAGHPALECFALGGGTSLALRTGHRLSVDLDYFTREEFRPEGFAEQLGLETATTVSIAKNSLTLDYGGVKIDLLRHAYPQVSPPEVIEGIRLLSVPDIAAMKLNAIANRGAKKDFHDLAELLLRHSLQETLGFFATKYPATDPFTVVRSLAWFDDAEAEPDPVSLTDRTWDSIKDTIRKAVAAL